MSVADAVRDLVAPVVDRHGLELVDVEHGRGLLRIYLDRPGGIDLEAIADASELISRLLDEHDPVPGSYTLEVSSPGVERPLRTPSHFVRFVGETVTVHTREGGTPEDRRVHGVLSAADADGIEVTPDDAVPRRIAYADIDRARTVFEWGPGPKPGKGPKKPKKRASTP